MKSYLKYQNNIQLTKGHIDPYEAKQLQQTMEFNYFQAIGELIYALSICQVDISLASIALNQHSEAPAKIHYDAVKQIFSYLHAAKTSWNIILVIKTKSITTVRTTFWHH